MQTSSGARRSASWRKAVRSSSFRASNDRPTICPPRVSTSATRAPSLSPLRRPAKTVKPSAANRLAIAAPMKSPAPITAAVAFLSSTTPSADDPPGRGLEDLIREPLVVDGPRQDQGTGHARERRNRAVAPAFGVVAGHQPGQEVHRLLQLPGEGGPNR